jgi:GT2 family glycosyltransferase
MESLNIFFLILNYKSHKDTISFVRHILSQEDVLSLLPILIVDNFSSDHSFEILQQEFRDNQKIEVIQTQKNGGYGYGNNWGIKHLKNTYNPEFIIISNPDITADVTIIPEMLKAFLVDKKIATVSVQMMNSQNKHQLSAWTLPNLFDDIILSVGLIKAFLKNPVEYPKTIVPHFVDVLQGAFFMIKSKAMEEIGGYDENLFLYGEERILGFKLKEKGYKQYFLPHLSFIHHVGKTINKVFPSKLSKFKILQKSRRHYQKEYLNQNRIGLFVFDCFTLIGIIEKLILDLITDMKSNENH